MGMKNIIFHDGLGSVAFRFFGVLPRNGGEVSLDRLHMMMQLTPPYSPATQGKRMAVMFLPKSTAPIALIGPEISLK